MLGVSETFSSFKFGRLFADISMALSDSTRYTSVAEVNILLLDHD